MTIVSESMLIQDLPASVACIAAVLILGIALFWTSGILKWRSIPGGDSPALPTVSVLVAGRNEELYVRSALESILQCDYPPDKFSVLFIDDHSADETFALAQSLASKIPGRLNVVSAPPVDPGRSPKKNALAFGIRQTHGDILLFTDADSRVKPGWMRAMVSAYERDTGAVAGATMPISKNGLHQRLYRLERFMAALTSASAIGHGSPASVTGQNFSFRRAAFDDVGEYAHPGAASGDDDLMAQAVSRQGWKVKFCPDPESVVADLRPPVSRAHLAAAGRHQSTVRFYPWRWRLVYLLTILAGWSVVLGVAFSLFHRQFLVTALAVLVLKVLIDGLGANRFARRLRIQLSTSEFLLGEALLPFYLLARPMLAFRSSFDWRGRTHSMTRRPSTGIQS